MEFISIIISTCNRAQFIEEALSSIRHQTIQNWECLVIDDGSTDATEKIVKEIVKKDERVKYFKRDSKYKKGLPGARNMGLDIASGEYVLFVDDDDVVHPECLETCLGIMRTTRSSFCRYDKKSFVGEWDQNLLTPIGSFKSKKLGLIDLGKMITGRIPFASCCVLWNRDAFHGNRFNEELMYAEEWEFYSRILSQGHFGISIDQVLYFNRKHEDSNTGEFYRKNVVRVRSQLQAASLVLSNLSSKDLMNNDLTLFFIRMGFSLNSKELINETLRASKAGVLQSIKYKLGYTFYPFLRPVLRIKAKIKKE